MNGIVAEYKKSIVFGGVNSDTSLHIKCLCWVDSCFYKHKHHNLTYKLDEYLRDISKSLLSRLITIHINERTINRGTEI